MCVPRREDGSRRNVVVHMVADVGFLADLPICALDCCILGGGEYNAQQYEGVRRQSVRAQVVGEWDFGRGRCSLLGVFISNKTTVSTKCNTPYPFLGSYGDSPRGAGFPRSKAGDFRQPRACHARANASSGFELGPFIPNRPHRQRTLFPGDEITRTE